MPERLQHDFPSWFNPEGAFMKIVPQDELSIVKLKLEDPKNERNQFEIREDIYHGRGAWHVGCCNDYGTNPTFMCSIWLSTQALRWMFGLDVYEMNAEEQRLLEFFGGDSLCWGVYIRRERYLNFLIPNMGKVTSPSKSIVITADILEEVKKFL